ncbi:hypothetical protein VTN02DRAFT_2659 [Thermoascus thermophilus]
MAIEWSLDFCLVCDRQTFGGAYCSQACRLAELDQLSSEHGRSSPTASNAGKGVTENMPVNSAMDPTTHRYSAAGFGQPMAAPISRGYSHLLSDVTPSSSRVLCPSSSQTSLSSLQSASSSQPLALSDRVRDELRDYASCFDQVRDWKRRLTTS